MSRFVIIMFDICKIYPIWLPPCEDDAFMLLKRAIGEFSKACYECLSRSAIELSDNFLQIAKALNMKGD